MARVGIIINPNAGGNAATAERQANLQRAAGRDGVVLATRSLEDLPRAARELARLDIDVLGVCGGDGSFFRSLSACLPEFTARPLPFFLPLPAGSMNTIATSLGWRRRPLEDMVTSIARCDDVRSLVPVEREVIRVNGVHYGFMVGVGVIVNFLAAYYAEPGRGPIAATRLAARFIGSVATRGPLARQLFASVDASVSDGPTRLAWSRYNIIYAATIQELGLGFRVAHRAGKAPGMFHILAGEPALGRLIFRLPHVKFGWPTGVAQLHDALSSRATIRFPRPTRYMIDGDILEPVDAIDLEVGPRLRILL